MTVRTDVSVQYNLSPRIVRVAAPSTEIIIQDLHDTLRDIEDEPGNMQYPALIETTGKQSLGGTVTVGLTAELKNARLSFDARKASLVSGSASGADATGVRLTDATATFIADGVEPGMWIVNLTDGSICSVLVVESETQIVTDALGDGADNEWAPGDQYKIWPVIQTEVSGGNLVAVDEANTNIDAVLPTAGTQVVRTSASSATLTDQQLSVATKYLVESLRPHHGAFGSIFFWDPVAGNDSNGGTLPTEAVKTFAAAHALCVSGRADAIFVVNESGSQLHINDRLVISKIGVQVRANGSVVVHPLAGTAPGATITADNVGVEGISFLCSTPGMTACVRVTGCSGFYLSDVAVAGGGATEPGLMHAVEIIGGYGHQLHRFVLSDVSGNGLHLEDAQTFFADSGRIFGCGDWGIEILASSAGATRAATFDRVVVDSNLVGGVHIGADVVETMLAKTCYIAGDHPTRVLDEGTGTHLVVTEEATDIATTTTTLVLASLPAATTTEILAAIIDGTITVQAALVRLNALVRGRVTLSGASVQAAQDAVYYDEAGAPLYTNRNTGNERNPL